MRSLTGTYPSILTFFGATAVIAQAALVSGNNITNVTSLPNESQLYKTAAEIDMFQQSYSLIRVDATSTHAALQPGWPETLISLVLAVYSFLTANGSTNSKLLNFVFKIFIPFALSIAWTVAFSVVQKNTNAAGWISVTFYPTGDIPDLETAASDWRNLVLGLMVFVTSLLNLLQFFGSLAIVGQRWGWIGFGSVAYNISDPHGCVPFNNDFSYLERGFRSHSFKILQTVQYFWGLVAVMTASAGADTETRYKKKGRRTKSTKRETDWPVWKQRYSMVTCLIIVPSLIYETVIATQGTPVKVSGNCLLVELNPKLGFLDTDIDNWWKGLVSFTGL